MQITFQLRICKALSSKDSKAFSAAASRLIKSQLLISQFVNLTFLYELRKKGFRFSDFPTADFARDLREFHVEAEVKLLLSHFKA